MSTVQSQVYDYAVVPTLSDTVNDPAGPFASVLITGAPVSGGTIAVFPWGGPSAGLPLVIQVLAGQLLPFPIGRIGATGTTVQALGLVANSVCRQGGFTR